MPAIFIDVNLFGTKEQGFLDAIKHYSDIKSGYDATISSYGRAAYNVRPLAPEKPTVPVRNNISFQERIASAIPGLEVGQEAIAFKFFVPLRKGFQLSVNAELISWDGSEVLAKIEGATGSYVEPEDLGNSPDDLAVNAAADDYAYFPISLKGLPGDDFDNPANFLQTKIERWRNNNLDISSQVFILRVWQMVWPAGKDKAIVESADFEARDDSIIIEIED